MKTYEIICKESLAMPLGKRPPNFSRINEDGTPFQFSLSLAPGKSPLQFLSEAGVPGSSCFERIILSRERINTLAKIYASEKVMFAANTIFDRFAPSHDPDLLADPAGAFWIGTSFSPIKEQKIKVYINGKWGPEDKMWTRLDMFASYFSGNEQWDKIKKTLMARMKPLGMSVTLSKESSLNGRIYVYAFGNTLTYYGNLIELVTNQEYHELFKSFIKIILGKECKYPMGSVVCSFEFGNRKPDFKFELCGHCVFANDFEAKKKILNWQKHVDVDPSIYLSTLEVMSEGCLSRTHNNLHRFVGLGLKQKRTYTSVYLKPSLNPSRKK